jgi:hypothetical protein
VTHNLNKRPRVSIYDSVTKEEIEGVVRLDGTDPLNILHVDLMFR